MDLTVLSLDSSERQWLQKKEIKWGNQWSPLNPYTQTNQSRFELLEVIEK